MESSHETVSSGGVQGSSNVESSHETVSNGGVQGSSNVEGSHESVSSGGDKGGLGRGLAVMPPSCGNGCEKCAELNVLTM